MTNPFLSRRIRPGAVAYCFHQDDARTKLLATVATAGFRGAVVGPHGSGKSTLLATLREHLEEQGHRVRLIELHDGQYHLPRPVLADLQPCDVLFIDGYEQLGWLSRRKLQHVAWRQNLSLLVTAHAEVDLPIVYRTQTTLSLARHLVQELAPHGIAPLTDDDVARSFERHRGDLREMLFELYDLYEERTRQGK